MKKHLITLIIAASAVIHAQSAELASQLEGYWQPDMEKTLALAKKAKRELDPMTQAMMGKMVFEFQKERDLEKIEFRNKRVINIDALAGFVDLEVLDLSSTPVSDIGFLKNAKKLRELNLGNTQVTDISALAGIASLEILNLSDTKVTDLSPLLPMLRASGLPLLELPEGLSDQQIKALTEATTLPPDEMQRIAPTGLTLVVCDPDNAVLDTLVVKPDAGSAEYIFPIPQGLGEIRVFGVGSRMEKNPALWDDIHETFTQYYTVARTDDRISQVVTAHLKDGVLSFFGTSINAVGDSRPMPLTETLRNQIQADIAANKRTVPIFLREKPRPGSLHGRTNRIPVE